MLADAAWHTCMPSPRCRSSGGCYTLRRGWARALWHKLASHSSSEPALLGTPNYDTAVEHAHDCARCTCLINNFVAGCNIFGSALLAKCIRFECLQDDGEVSGQW